tara:strand:- start:515 stop:1000 length:486 start_codon:yes stop_codon:yes gene_type:complete
MKDSLMRRKLQNIQITSITAKNLNDAGGKTFLSDVNGMKDSINIASQVQKLRTFGAFPDPGGGDVSSSEGTNHTLKPENGNQFELYAISAANNTGGPLNLTAQLTNGSSTALLSTVQVDPGASNVISLQFPIILTETLYLVLSSSGVLTFSAAYQNTVRGE